MSVAPAAAEGELELTLRDALTLAEENAFQVKAAFHDSVAAEQGLRAAKAGWFPNVNVASNAIGFHPQDALGLGFLQIEPEWHSIYVTNLSLRYPIFTGGRRMNDIRRNREDVGAAKSHLDAARLSNAYQCRQAYIGLLVADRMLRSAEASANRVAAIRNDVQNLFAVGMADSIDVLDTEVSTRQVRRLLEQARNDRRNASLTLARLLGLPADLTIVPTESIPTPQPDSDARLSGPDAPLERPELAALDHEIGAAEYQRSIVKGDFWPVINGMGGYAFVRPDIGQPGVDWKDIWWVGLTLSWELNLGGREFAQSTRALEQLKSLEMKRKDVEDSMILRARIAWNNVQEAYALYEINRDEYTISKRRFGLAEEMRNEGQMTVNRLVELEADLTGTEQQFEAARLRYFAAVTDYIYAIGSKALWEGM